MSQKPQPQSDEEKNKRKRKKKSKQTITRAVPHIRLSEANPGGFSGALSAVCDAMVYD